MSRNKNNSDLDSNILFEGVNPEILQSFANPKNTIGKKEGAVIYQKGDLTEYLYLLIEGSVKLKFTEPDGTNIYINKSENSFFGETELLGKTQRKSSAVADTDCRMYTFNLSELKILVKKDKHILQNLFNNKTFDILKDDFIESTKDFLDPETDYADLIRTTNEKLAKKFNDSEENASIPEEKETAENEQGKFDSIIAEEEIKQDLEKAANIPEKDDTKEDDSIVIGKTEEEGEKEIPQSEHNVFDHIITKDEETDEVLKQHEEDVIKEDDSVVIGKTEEVDEENIPQGEHNAFDHIITKDEEIEEDLEQLPEKETVENIVHEDDTAVPDEVEEEKGTDQLEESEGFIIEDSPADEFIESGETLKTFVLEEPVPEQPTETEEENIDTSGPEKVETDDSPVLEQSEPEQPAEREEEYPAELESEKKVESDFSDYYETLLNATQNIFSKITIDETAQVIAESAIKLVNATGGVLYLVDKENEELKAKVLSDNSIKEIRVKFSDGLQGTAVIEKRSIILENPNDNKNFNPVIEDLTGLKIKNVIYYPVLTQNDDPIAVLELYNSERGKFDSREIELLNAISSSVQRALNNAKYVDILVNQRKILSLGEITGFIKDDIKSSLLKIKHYSSLLKKKDLPPEVNKLIDLQIGQINSVEDFLRFTDAYAHGKNIAQQNTIKVSEAVTQILNFLAEYVDSRNTVIYKKIEDDVVISVDLPAMYIACYQITKNACDAMSDNGKIFVTSERDGNYIKIKFRDEGVGISETIKEKLFKPFISYGKKQRSGLGLAVAEKLVTDQGGYVLAESVLGEGATFTIALPIVF